MFQDENLSPPPSAETHRRLSLAPPNPTATPIISLPSDDNLGRDKNRRPSAQSLGPFSFSVSLFGDSRRNSYQYSDSRRSSERLRRPSTHSVGILPIAMFGEGTEKPRKPSTHSLGVFPMGWNENELFPSYESPRRPSAHSLGPFWSSVSPRHVYLYRWPWPSLTLWPLNLYLSHISLPMPCAVFTVSCLENFHCYLWFVYICVHLSWIQGKFVNLCHLWPFKSRKIEYRYTRENKWLKISIGMINVSE